MISKMTTRTIVESFDISIPVGIKEQSYFYAGGFVGTVFLEIEGIDSNRYSINQKEDSFTINMNDEDGCNGTCVVLKIDESLRSNVKIYRHIKSTDNFATTNYDLLGLKKERTFVDGELSIVNYWENFDEETGVYSGLVVKEDVVYNRDENDYIKNREKTHTWFDVNEVAIHSKKTEKVYSTAESAVAGERKRDNVLTTLKIETVGIIAQTQQITVPDAEVLGMGFIVANDSLMNMYKLGAKQPLIDSINNDTTNTWLNNDLGGQTVRNYMVSKL